MGFENVGTYMILGLVGANFLFELGANILLCPTILRLIRIGKKEEPKPLYEAERKQLP